MKSNLIIVFLTIILISGCIEDTLDRKPLDMITDADVWKSENVIDIFLATLYDEMPMGAFRFYSSPYSIFLSGITDEAAGKTSVGVTNNYGNHSFAHNTSAYQWIRQTNIFLDKIETADIPEANIKQYIAEVRFIRAYFYFDLVRKYGGMPIITEVQVFQSDNLEELQVSRNKEQEVYDFIKEELDAAYIDLPDSWDSNNANRATKMAALALKSRAMLYAGSIAKYGQVQLNGLIGIPSDRADLYFTESINASKEIIQSNKFELYRKFYDFDNKTGDPIENYQNLFWDKDNNEVILQKAFSYPDKCHDWDRHNVPEGYTTAFGSSIVPPLDMVESYEYIDGTPGILDFEDKVFDTPTEVFKNKDPRFEASILHGGSPFAGETMQIYRGIYDADGTLYQSYGVPFPKDPSKMQIGKSGPFDLSNFSRTGFYVLKFTRTPNLVIEAGQSDQNYPDIRYAEILLNFAEAAVETETQLSEALEAINKIRRRAGIRELNPVELTIDRIRNERKVELAFEDKRFWDIRRWRIGNEVLRGKYLRGLYPYLVYDGTSYKYIYEEHTGYPIDGGLPQMWEEKDYYSNLSSYIGTNEKIVNNPGW